MPVQTPSQKRLARAEAETLLRYGFRPSIVTEITGIEERAARAIFRELHGRTPQRGAAPTTQTILATAEATEEAILFSVVYAKVQPNYRKDACIHQVAKAYRIYCEMRGEWFGSNPLSATDCWTLARSLRSYPLLRLSQCSCRHRVPILEGDAVTHPGCNQACLPSGAI